MKIIFVGPTYPFRGGIAAFNDRLAIQLLKEGHTIKNYTFSLQYPSFLFPGESQYSESKKPSDIETIECINSINPLNWIKTSKLIKKEKADLIISRFWIPFMGPSLGSILRWSKGKNTKIISIVDNLIPHESRPGDKVLTKYFTNSNDAFITLSEEVLKDLQAIDSKREKICSPHPLYDHYGELIDKKEAIKTLQLDPNKKYLMFFGLVRAYKGLDLLLEAFSKAKELHENHRIIIAGEYYDKKEIYDELISKYKIEEYIHQTNGFIPDDRVNLYFSASDLIVQPYKTATQSGVTQIAYHFEKPMIVTDVGGLSEICPDGVVGYISQANSDDLAEKLVKFFSSESDRFLPRIQTEKAKYSWSIFTEKLIRLYNKVN